MGVLRNQLKDRLSAGATPGDVRPVLKPLVMAVMNVTPDSFSDGGKLFDAGRVDEKRAIDVAERLLADGADLVDIGAESTRPRSTAVPSDEQIARLGGIIACLVRNGGCVSIDTTLAEVAEFALSQGASLVNSVSLEAAASLGGVAHTHGALLALMHSRGSMHAMRGFSDYPDLAYSDVVEDVFREWEAARDRAVASGLDARDVLFDPGLGFHKNARQSLALSARLDEFVARGLTVLVGPSRKSYLLGDDSVPDQRLGASVAASFALAEKGAAILRVHDVAAVRQALTFLQRLRGASDSPRKTAVQGTETEFHRDASGAHVPEISEAIR
jgi:dihydropteroate synthase